MKRPVRGDDGNYHIDGKMYLNLFGSRQQVWNGNAYKTSGCLKKNELFYNKWGRIVSIKKHYTAKKEKRLEKHGFFATRGKFGFTRKATSKRRTSKKTKKNKQI